jgi:hypothetical protein
MDNLEEKTKASNQELILQCLNLILEKPDMSDRNLMFKTIELVLNKNPNRRLDDVIEESKKLFDFIKEHD